MSATEIEDGIFESTAVIDNGSFGSRTIRFETGLPREDSGKIMKRKLRDPYWEATGRRI